MRLTNVDGVSLGIQVELPCAPDVGDIITVRERRRYRVVARDFVHGQSLGLRVIALEDPG